MTGTITTIDPSFKALFEAGDDRLDRDLIERAYRFSRTAHRGQKRASGEDFITHSVEVAKILLEQRLDSVSVAAALLHDVVEDADFSVDDITNEFGFEVGGIVDGLTKISHLSFRSRDEEQIENYRKLLLSIAKDARVIIVKLADRLHNMRTLGALDQARRQRIAVETREIYSPLAHRFGMGGIKAELEDLAFKEIEPDAYYSLAQELRSTREERAEMIQRLSGPLGEAFRNAGLDDFEVKGRPKHLWSIFRKMQQREKPLNEIYDLMAVRIILPTVKDCYHALGIIHQHWVPLQERFKDYIASPKSNAYQSLHTTVFGPGGQLYEIQIRTQEMHRTAEYGIAAHWVYKERRGPTQFDHQFSWFRQLLELQLDQLSAGEFIEFLKIDLFQDEIFVFTPKGDVKQLPADATPIDFAFAVHTEVGLRCQGARVNGRIAPLHRKLKNGDTVEVITGNQPRPSRDWLNHVQTARARHKIRQWIRAEEAERSIALGKDILARELRRRRLSQPDDDAVKKAADRLSLGSGDGLYRAVGSGDIALGLVIKELFPEQSESELEAPKPTGFGKVLDRIRLGRGVRVEGIDGIMVRYAQCCQPVPGDKVVGYVTQGRGISIHRADCPNLLNLSNDPERRVEIDWRSTEGEVFMVSIGVVGEDRRGLFADLMSAISQTGTNIKEAELSSKDAAIEGLVLVEVENSSQLGKVINEMRRVKGVVQVERREPTSRGPTVED